jgi:hypothetical protein
VEAQKSGVRDRQLDVVDGAHAAIHDDFRAIEARLLTEARDLASSQAVVQSMRGLEPGRTPAAGLVRHLADIEGRQRTALEVYDPTPRLVAWSGFSLPIDDSPSRPRFLESVQTAIATDGDRRVALVVWVPISDGVRTLGAVRAMQVLELRVPVENRFLQPYSQSDQWSRRTGSSVSVIYDAPFDDELPARGEVRLLTGVDGSPLARVFIDPPAPQELADRVADRFDDVMVMWQVLILFWLVGGAWAWYRADTGRNVPVRHSRFVLFGAIWIGLRYILLALDVPARFQPGKSPLAALFDPTHLASNLAGGVARSIGDLLVTSLFLLTLGLAAVGHVARRAEASRTPSAGESGRFIGSTMGRGTVLAVALVLLALTGAVFAKAVVLDSTLDYFTRSGLVPGDLALLVFTGQFVVVLAVLMLGIACARAALGRSSSHHGQSIGALGAAAAVAGTVTYLLIPAGLLTVPVASGFVGSVLGVTLILSRRQEQGVSLLTLRHVLPGIFVVTLLAYPMMHGAVDAQKRMRMVDAAETYEDGRDPRALYAVERALRDARSVPAVKESLRSDTSEISTGQLDSLATDILRTSFLASLGSYEISLTFHDGSGTPRGRYYEAAPRMSAAALSALEREQLGDLRRMYAEARGPEVLVEPITGRQDRDRFEYHGLTELTEPDGETAGWIVVRAEPRTLLQEAGTPFPKVLVPAGSYGIGQGSIEVAVFRNQNLVRSTGDAFGRYRLSDETAQVVSRQRC